MMNVGSPQKIQPGLAPLRPGGSEHHQKSAAGSSAVAAPGQILHDCPLEVRSGP